MRKKVRNTTRASWTFSDNSFVSGRLVGSVSFTSLDPWKFTQRLQCWNMLEHVETKIIEKSLRNIDKNHDCNHPTASIVSFLGKTLTFCRSSSWGVTSWGLELELFWWRRFSADGEAADADKTRVPRLRFPMCRMCRTQVIACQLGVVLFTSVHMFFTSFYIRVHPFLPYADNFTAGPAECPLKNALPFFDLFGACFPHVLHIPRGSKLKKLYLDSTSTTVGNFDCSISEPLGKRQEVQEGTMVPPLMVDPSWTSLDRGDSWLEIPTNILWDQFNQFNQSFGRKHQVQSAQCKFSTLWSKISKAAGGIGIQHLLDVFEHRSQPPPGPSGPSGPGLSPGSPYIPSVRTPHWKFDMVGHG